MNLAALLNNVDYRLIAGDLNIDITAIEYDSRKVSQQGTLFACISGETFDGHKFAGEVVEKGAVALLVEKEVNVAEHVAVILVDDIKVAQSQIANDFYKEPSKNLNIIGVTGTNGKTTTTNLIEKIFIKAGQKTGVIGTIENRIGEIVVPTNHTTPQAFDLQELFNEMVTQSVETIAMEVSSHALALHRVDGTQFSTAVFTNLTLDHLDYHKTMEAYLEAKIKLFKIAKKGLVNLDDPVAKQVINEANCKVYTFGINHEEADFRAENLAFSASGSKFTLVCKEGRRDIAIATPGKFSVYNALAAAGTAILNGIEIDVVKAALEETEYVKGRFQTIVSEEGYSAIVDYAHAPDGLVNVLNTIQEFAKEKIITVFGCGGDRDKTKRPIMGKVAGEASTFCVITSDNPRTEDPFEILNQVEEGVKETKCEYVKIEDRRKAIHFAIDMAQEGDVILIAGKGHEDYQILGHTKIHFDDVEEVEKYMEEKHHAKVKA